jgi:hypothetical protein
LHWQAEAAVRSVSAWCEFSGQSAQAFHAAPGSEVSTPARMDMALYHRWG